MSDRVVQDVIADIDRRLQGVVVGATVMKWLDDHTPTREVKNAVDKHYSERGYPVRTEWRTAVLPTATVDDCQLSYRETTHYHVYITKR